MKYGMTRGERQGSICQTRGSVREDSTYMFHVREPLLVLYSPQNRSNFQAGYFHFLKGVPQLTEDVQPRDNKIEERGNEAYCPFVTILTYQIHLVSRKHNWIVSDQRAQSVLLFVLEQRHPVYPYISLPHIPV